MIRTERVANSDLQPESQDEIVVGLVLLVDDEVAVVETHDACDNRPKDPAISKCCTA